MGLDALGIYRYTEADQVSLGAGSGRTWSDYMNLLPDSLATILGSSRYLMQTSDAGREAAVAAVTGFAGGVPGNEAQRVTLQNLGLTVVRPDKGWEERYYATYNSVSNPQGATVPGWYPTGGRLPYGLIKQGTTAAQSCATGTDTNITAYTVTDGGFVQGGVTASGGQLVVSQPGRYRIKGAVGFAANATGIRLATLVKSGAQVIAYGAALNAQSVAHAITPVEAPLVPLSAGDTVMLRGFHNSGAALLTINAASGGLAIASCALEVQYVSPL